MSSQLTGTIIYFVIIAAVFYFLIIRPQMQRQRDQASLVSSLAEGDRVITAGGVYGTIRKLDEDTMDLEVADGIVVQVARAAVSRKVEA